MKLLFTNRSVAKKMKTIINYLIIFIHHEL